MICISKLAFSKIQGHFVSFDEEKGGALLIRSGLIFEFLPLVNVAEHKNSSYSFSFGALNEALDSYDEFDGFGIIHSHCPGYNGTSLKKPSKEDRNFYENFAEKNKTFEPLLFPIVSKGEDGLPQIDWFRYQNGFLDKIEVEIVE